MCGIAGILKFNGSTATIQEIDHFSEPINHRGPDDSNSQLYNHDTIALAHKRLSILDLSTNAAQPMISQSKKHSIVYNGEIFNFIELKAKLSAKGYSFQTGTDTEVVLNAYEEWGTECFNMFNGMWAMAIYNHHSHEILLSRDRFGIKPLFYRHYGPFLAFASETNCFKNIPNHPRSFNHDTLTKTLIDPYYANSISSSIFEGIEQLKPGHYMTVGQAGITSTHRYYNFRAACAEISDIDYQTGDFLDLFTDAVKLRLRSDVPIATAFSGGLDSTAVFSMIKHLAKSSNSLERLPSNWQTPFCMAMQEDDKINDLPFAKAALKELNAEAQYIYTDNDSLFDNIVCDTTFYDDIIGTPLTSITGIYSAMKQQGFSVSMDGHGADEYLFGYRNMVMELFYNSQAYKGKKYSKRLAKVLIEMYHKDDQRELKSKLKKEMKKAYNFPNYLKRLARNTFTPDDPEKGIVFDNIFKTPLPSLLKTFDKASMLNGVEIRMPFMDYRLIEMCYNLDNEYKLNNGQTKWILREELKNIMPPSTLARNYKIGVQAPIKNWLNGQDKSKFNELLNDGKHKDYISKYFINKEDKNIYTYWRYLNLQMIDL